MANSAPATVVITAPIGPGDAVSALSFTDVNNIEFDFLHNLIKIARTGSGGTQIYAYDSIATISVTISGGLSTFTIST
jgi:hypothetical protein